MTNFSALLAKAAKAVDKEMDDQLPGGQELEHRLFDAMRYATL
ncbi:uncharacterized protein METZ01_LOCUS129991, partial [marine metagenome]